MWDTDKGIKVELLRCRIEARKPLIINSAFHVTFVRAIRHEILWTDLLFPSIKASNLSIL